MKNTKFMLLLLSSSPPTPPPLCSIHNYIPQTTHVARQLFYNYMHGTIIAAATVTTRIFNLNSFKFYLTIIT